MSEATRMKCYYCHECSQNFLVRNDTSDPMCTNCGSGFVELLDTEEAHTIGGGGGGGGRGGQNPATPTLASAPLPPVFVSSSTTASTTDSTQATATTATAATAAAATTTTTTTTSTGTSRGPPINITIGSNPMFRRGYNPFMPGGHGVPVNPFTAGGGSLSGRDSPMDTEGEDPGDEVINPDLRRRTNPQVRGGHRGQFGMFPGEMFMISQSSRGGPSAQSLGQMIHEHIQNVLSQQRGEEGTDEGQQAGGEQQGQPSQQQQQQQQQRQQQPQAGATGGGQATGAGAGIRRNNVRVVNFPPVQVMMSRGLNPQQRQQQQAAALGTGQAGSANPQLPQFGMPMFFGLPLGGGLGLHGSPSDYAWGPQGLENVISQMLANLEDDGPPPTKKEKLDSLPVIESTAEELAQCSLCSVCKDSFTEGERLLQLPCTHLYHKDCILPWLELHDTCPTCRFHLNTGKYDEERTD